MVNMNGMNFSKWNKWNGLWFQGNEWDGLWSEGIKMKCDKRGNKNEWLDVMCCKPRTEHFCLSVSI